MSRRTRREVAERQRRERGARARLRRHLRTPDESATPATGWARHLSPAQATAAALGAFLTVAIAGQVVAASAWFPGSEANLRRDPAVTALLAVQRGSLFKEPLPNGAPLRVTTLTNGDVQLSTVGEAGRCLVRILPAAASSAPSGVRIAAPAECGLAGK